jgi:hypothetical protein
MPASEKQEKTMVLMNYVRPEPGVPTRMHFTDWYSMDRDIAVPETGKTKRVHSEVFQVDELDGEDVNRTFSVLSQKLWSHLEPFLEGRRFRDYDFIITQMGDGFLKDWNVQPILRPKSD